MFKYHLVIIMSLEFSYLVLGFWATLGCNQDLLLALCSWITSERIRGPYVVPVEKKSQTQARQVTCLLYYLFVFLMLF